MSISVFLPTRKGSERVKNKNTRKFSNFEGGLLELKLIQLKNLPVDEIILSTNDEESLAVAKNLDSEISNLIIDKRPNHLASSSTSLTNLIEYVPGLTANENILWTHVTSPMVDSEIYRNSIQQFNSAINDGFDSLMSVNVFQNFLWDEKLNDLTNREGNLRWPRTQDLKKLYEINSAIFITPRQIYLQNSDRVGKNPFLFKMNKLTSLDVDWEDDFKIAEVVYEKFR
ncbi:acylneuraminate cytidylyltransferase [Gramella sp. MAR_2010_147]|uniref:acylneuraminate cytidylyltransferase family protein n=1 Tax=Gramella sp. MAR_2010_147 TaxID=1250205 RepID=UPI00087CAB92|nr:acylneuraminate cytidylyltransferase [Gramella sp. MAR_2010_147]SDR69812.1 N-acylneuraminate cytidylyltransferase [Gramella sp. MAR_2010_147]